MCTHLGTSRRLLTRALNTCISSSLSNNISALLATRQSASIKGRYWFSTVKALSGHDQPIKILYASQTGTAKLFAYQLNEELTDEYPERKISLSEFREVKPDQMLEPNKALHIFLTSVAGVGEPPDNGREFYEYIMDKSNKNNLSGLEYAVFGLGSTAGHAAYFNVIGKSLDQRLEELGASRIMEIGLGDDGDCIEDDFDNWQDKLMTLLKKNSASDCDDVEQNVGAEEVIDNAASAIDVVQQREQMQLHEAKHSDDLSSNNTFTDDLVIKCPGALSEDGTRFKSNKFQTLALLPKSKENNLARHKHLFHLNNTSNQFYAEGTDSFSVIGNELLGVEAGESGIHELKLASPNVTYTTGDHLVVYPQNSQCIVEAYLNMLNVDGNAVIDENQPDSYPFPKSLTIFETLTHCVDLGALPSPSFARMLIGKKDIDYKSEVAYPRRTVLDLALQYGRSISLEDLLYQASPMKPRYYSIASSSVKHPNMIRLVYRRVQYVTKLGMLREGICTNYLTHKGYIDTQEHAHIAAYVNINPTFRLPKSIDTPILMVAGGCGVAPIRALVEERVALVSSQNNGKLGPAALYLGFRSPEDEVYRQTIDDAIKVGALTNAKVTYSSGCGKNALVSDVIREDAIQVWNHFESGGVTYTCGGARSFGAAVESAFLDIVQECGEMDFAGAEQYLRKMIKDGRLMDDLAD